MGLGYPRSLAATSAISVDFLSSGYLDVSVPPGCPLPAYVVRREVPELRSGGLPGIRRPAGQSVLPPPQIIAACRVLRSLPMPRHPPCARNIFASFALSPALRQGRPSKSKVFSGIHINVHCDRDMRTTCDNPKIDCLENESEGFSLMILTSVNWRNLQGARLGGRPLAVREGPGTGDCENEGWGIQALRTLFSP